LNYSFLKSCNERIFYVKLCPLLNISRSLEKVIQTNKQRPFYGDHKRRAITITRTYFADSGTGTLLPEAKGLLAGLGTMQALNQRLANQPLLDFINATLRGISQVIFVTTF
jgi:hypothetical protein